MTSLNKICLHWSAGANFPCNVDLEAYHFCIDKLGRIYRGNHKPDDNLDCTDGNYAKHCGGGNTGCIGLSVCGMAGFDLKNKKTQYPLTQKQVETLCCFTGYLSNLYGIPISENSVFTHYEFDRRQKKKQGKTDITFLPYIPTLSSDEVGSYLRKKAVWYKQKIQENKYKLEKKGQYYEFTYVF